VKIIDNSTFPSEILSDQRDESMRNLIDNVSARTVRHEFKIYWPEMVNPGHVDIEP